MKPTTNEKEHLFELITSGDVEALRSLLGGSPDLAGAKNDQNLSACMVAQYHRKPEVVELLLAGGPVLDVFDAAALGKARRLEELLDQDRGLISTHSGDGFTPLHLAAFFGHPETVKPLLDASAAVNAVAQNPTRVQPLHSAAASRKLHVVAMLPAHGAEANAQQQGGWTVLHAAALHDDLEMVRLLLAYGADPALKSDDGERAIDKLPAGAGDEIRRFLATS